MEVEEEKFARRLDDLLPLLEREINPNNYEDVRPPPSYPSLAVSWSPCVAKLIDDDGVLQIEEEQDEKGADRLLFGLLTLISKLNKHCGLLELSKPHDTLCNIWGEEASVTSAHTLVCTYTSRCFCACSSY